jgi:hypothetical protein
VSLPVLSPWAKITKNYIKVFWKMKIGHLFLSIFCFLKKLLGKTCFVTINENYAVVTKILIVGLL